MSAPCLSTEGLCIGVGGAGGSGGANRVLARDVSFALNEGTALAILGPNGAGKTTLFRTLLGLHPTRGGRVLVGGDTIDTLPPAELARRIAYVPQNPVAFFNFSVLDVIEMARAPHLAWYAQPGPQDREIARAALAQLGMADFASQPFAQLSGGERQLVLLARALASGARCLLLDEPTASLDFGNRLRVQDELLKLKAQGYALMFTTHEPQQAADLASGSEDRTLTIARDGSTRLLATAAATARDALAALYGIDAARVPSLSA